MQTIEFAAREARVRGQNAVSPDHLFVAVLRDQPMIAVGVLHRGGVDVRKLHALIAERLATQDTDEDATLPLDQAAAAALQFAHNAAERKRREHVSELHLLFGLLAPDDGVITDWLTSVGGSLEKIRAACETTL